MLGGHGDDAVRQGAGSKRSVCCAVGAMIRKRCEHSIGASERRVKASLLLGPPHSSNRIRERAILDAAARFDECAYIACIAHFT
jgi:hypothetical protein